MPPAQRYAFSISSIIHVTDIQNYFHWEPYISWKKNIFLTLTSSSILSTFVPHFLHRLKNILAILSQVDCGPAQCPQIFQLVKRSLSSISLRCQLTVWCGNSGVVCIARKKRVAIPTWHHTYTLNMPTNCELYFNMHKPEFNTQPIGQFFEENPTSTLLAWNGGTWPSTIFFGRE